MKLFLHIGAWKTGSSAIQAFLSRNVDALRVAGLHLAPRSQPLEGPPDVFRALTSEDETVRREMLDELRATADSGEGTLVVSSEHYWPLAPERVARLGDDLKTVTGDIEVLLYVRPQWEMWASLYAQQAKRFGVAPDASAWGTGDFAPPGFRDYALNYHKVLTVWADAFGREAVNARLYAREAFVGGNVVKDFLSACEIDESDEMFFHVVDINPSLGWKGIALSEWLVANVYPAIREANDEAVMRLAFRDALWDARRDGRDRAWIGGKTPGMRPSDRKAVSRHHAEDNARLFRDYFAGENVFKGRETPKWTPRGHQRIPKEEFSFARARLLERFREAGVNLMGREAAFEREEPTAPAYVMTHDRLRQKLFG